MRLTPDITLAQEGANGILPRVDAGPASVWLILGIVACTAVVFTVWVVRTAWCRHAQRRGFLGLIDDAGFEPVHGQDDLGAIGNGLGALFGEYAMYARQLRVAGALRRTEDDGLELVAAHLILGLEASNANITTLEKVVLTITGFPAALPQFSLVPNHFLFATVQKDTVFHHTGSFGRRNLVLGDDKWFIAHALSNGVRQLLADNRELVIESSGDQIAFYLNDERVQAADLPAFVERCLAITREIVANLPSYRPQHRPRRVSSPLLPV